MIAYNITDRTITFFAKGRPWAVASENAGYAPLKQLLIAGPAEGQDEAGFIDALLIHADVRGAILVASQGKLLLDEDDRFTYGGREIHNVWTDKILTYRKEGIPHDPIFKALEDLQSNPTNQAVERLPIFLERVGSGFLPDGRFTAFKGVRSDYMDGRTGTFRNMIGDKPAMDRNLVDANPDATCSRGLHVGAIGYVRNNYGGSAHKMMFVAVWPRDVVAVPTDYNGEKMRVCAYEVLDEVEPTFLAEFLSRNQHSVSGYSPVIPDDEQEDGRTDGDDEQDDEEMAAKAAYAAVTVGQWVRDRFEEELFQVVLVDDDDADPENRLRVRDFEGDLADVRLENFDGVEEAPRIALQATYNGQVRLEGHTFLRDGWFAVEELDGSENDEDDDAYVTILVDDESFGIKNRYVVEVKHKHLDDGTAPSADQAA